MNNRKFLQDKKGNPFYLIDGKIRSVTLRPNSLIGENYYYGDIIRKGVYTVITKTHFEKLVYNLLKIRYLKKVDGSLVWEVSRCKHGVYIRLDTSIPPTGRWEITGGGYHTSCGCGSADRGMIIECTDSPEDVIAKFSLEVEPFNCYGTKCYIIKPC